MEVSERAKQDFAIWKQIVDKNVSVVKMPRMSYKKLSFWLELMRIHKLEKEYEFTDERLKEYSITKTEPLIFYSGGLESSVIRSMFPTLDYVDYLKERVFPWTNPIEPALMIMGAGLGYGTVFYGSELTEGQNKRINDYRDFHVYRSMIWKAYSGSYFLSPISHLTKHDLFKIALRDCISFYSCFSNDPDHKWCGKCYKCLLIDMLYKLEGVDSPILMQVEDTDILSGKCGPINESEISVYKNLKDLWNKKKCQL